MKSRGMVKVVLSGVALMGLMMLSLLVVPADSSTEVYSVPARFMTHTAGQYSSLTQYFRMTCDSVLSVSFFNGWYPGQGTFWAELWDSTGALAWSGSRNTADSLKYKDVGFTVNTAVIRGKTYKLIVGYTYGFGGTDYHLDVYYDSTNVYPYGYMYPYYGNVDLCARVGGTNKIPNTMWGMNWFPYSDQLTWHNNTPTQAYSAKVESLGITVAREQILWAWAETSAGAWRTGQLDSAMMRVGSNATVQQYLINLMYTPKWASSCPIADTANSDSAAHYPPLNLTTSDTVITSPTCNYYLRAIKHLYQRYGPGGSFPKPIHWWCLYEEVNTPAFWRLPVRGADTSRTNGYLRLHQNDSIGAKMSLYSRMAEVVDSVVSGDPSHKVVAGGWCGVQGDTGKEHINKFLDNTDQLYLDGGRFIDVLSYHPYQWWSAEHKFTPSYFQRDQDTIRALLKKWGHETKAAWADEVGWGSYPDSAYLSTPDSFKQADIVVQLYNAAIGNVVNPGGELGMVNWYNLRDFTDSLEVGRWDSWVGLAHCHKDDNNTRPENKPSFWAFRQMNTKLKGLYFNRRVMFPDTNVYAYEFQTTDTGLATRKTWVVWKTTLGAVWESLSVRTNTAYYDSTYYRSSPPPTQPLLFDPNGSGKGLVYANSVPLYVYESTIASLHRPDVIVDSVWIVPTNPKAGDSLWFYARLKNIGNDSVKFNIVNKVTFQVDGVTKATYQATRGLAPAGDINHKDTLTVGNSNPQAPPPKDWQTNYGDHLIRAWADSADRYVELREDNNCGYLFKHISPKVSVLINNGNKFTNHFSNDTLNLAFNGGTTPQPDSMRVKNEGQWGSWIKPPVTTYVLNFDAGNGNGPRWDSVEIRQSGEADIGGDSIIVDASAPFVDIISPTQGQTVSGLVPFVGWSWDYEDNDSLWEIYVNGSPWCYGNSKVGENPMFGLPDTFGLWDSRTVPNGWRWHQLRSTDAATNLAKDSVKVKVSNHQTNSGDGWASNFGTLPSAPMNVATDPGGNVYFAETQNSKIRKYSAKKDSLFAFSARRSDSTGLNWAVGMVLKDTTILYVADGYAHCVKAFDRQGNLLLRFGSFGQEPGQFKQPCGIALDHKGRLFVVDRLNHRVQVFSDSSGGFLFQFGSQGADSGRFNSPTGIAYVPRDTALGRTQDLVYVSDTRNNQLQVFDSLGHYLKTIKQPDSLGFDTPTGICADKWGNVYVADTKNNRIVELNPFGERIFDFGGLGDSLWQFRTPVGVAVSPGAHYLYVADAGNRRVQRFVVIEEDTTGGGPQFGEAVPRIPLVNFLRQSQPNPTTGEAQIDYGLAQESPVSLKIYNVAGQVVREYNQGKQKAGYNSIKWDGRSNLGHKVGAGVYFYRLEAGSWVKTRKMVVIR